ncbi:LuxR family transcriptional regulator [Amycolatopsis sp. FDAARGOS 1241]|uniref:helix-turn-helix transcriptional regulator n=1 Tax=Amycolatopsis sp. FDAARGOS 1241 TaxID=2778070 RepID=UPI001951AA36|nr:LuxR family transcriptional regulator [Amycolatopsis sp. FDAARGOS 1241]QRP50932.1 AAA family ATPase [Amycolatopsis sp. FDAARGOS 1241]
MPSDSSGARRGAELVGRRAECAVLDALAADVRAGRSRTLVVHGEPGIGKTALLGHLAGAPGCRVVAGGGVQSEMEVAYAGLHQVCAPLLRHLGELPEPQRAALGAVFGISAGPAPDRLLVSLAVLSLFSAAAEHGPLLCLIDDQQWLDRTSAQVLAFVARRLGAEAVGLVFATRDAGGDLAKLPRLRVDGLRPADARALLDEVLPGPIDARVRDQLVAETDGNPLALLELPLGLTPAELAGGFGLPGATPLPGSIEEAFGRRYRALTAPARLVLLTAASDPSGDPALVHRAIAGLGIEAGAATMAHEAGLAVFGTRIRFRHPLARSAVYRSATPADRLRVHRALADATDPRADPDRRAWHRARAAPGPDEEVAAELERSANRARVRAGLAAAAAFLQQAAHLTPAPERRVGRALSAAHAELAAGALEATVDLLLLAEAGPSTDFQQAEAGLIRAQLAFVTNRGSDAPLLLVNAARRLESVDPELSRATYLEALYAAIFAGRLAGRGGDLLEVAQAAGDAPPPRHERRAPDLLLDGLAATIRHGCAAGFPVLREALRGFDSGLTVEEELHWLYLASIVALRIWDDGAWDALSARHLHLARDTGALSELPLALTSRSYLLLFSGDLVAVASLSDEVRAIEELTGSNLAPYGALGLAAFRGDETVARIVIRDAVGDVTSRGEGVGITFAEWATAVLGNGLGHYAEAFEAALRAVEYDHDPGQLVWVLPELIEAAVRSDHHDLALDAHARLATMTSAARTDWALGMQLRGEALLSKGKVAGDLYRESLEHLARTRMRVQLARTHLLYGEWLRRVRRHLDAREHLRTAHTQLDAMGIGAFADRAARELRAAGSPVRKRVDACRFDELTAQEAQIAAMARDGLSNPEIATRLFISARTVQYHLRKVFTKLGVTSRSQLVQALPH